MKRDFYEVLGLARGATDAELKRAYRKLAVQHHPDRNPGSEAAEELFKEAAEAYAVLSDPDKRARYDRYGHAGLGGSAGGFDPSAFRDFSDILGDFFGLGDMFAGGAKGGRRRESGADLRYDLSLSFEEAAFGVEKQLRIPRLEHCETCRGSGAREGAGSTTCRTCGGRGQVRFQQGFFALTRSCPQCEGSGETIADPCKDCRGQGRVQRERTRGVKIPAGVDSGARLRLSGEGEAGRRGGGSGDLYVVISVAEHAVFKRQDYDVVMEMAVSFSDAALGAEVKVSTLHGEQALKVPAGTQPGTVLKIRGAGIPRLDGRGQGDQYVQVTVRVPTRVSSEERQLLRRLAELDDSRSEKKILSKVKDLFA